MKNLIILILVAFSTLAIGQDIYTIRQVPTDKGGTWGAIPSSNGQLIFVNNASKVSRGDDFPSRLLVLDRDNKETALPTFSQYERIGSPYISSDGNEFYFTISGTVSSKTSGGNVFSSGTRVYHLQIMISKKQGSDWGPAEPFIHNNESYSNGDPCLSNDGGYLYFTSDRSGGHGGTDIWRSRRGSDGSWGEPENLGGAINTSGDERFPRFDFQGNLYFSSSAGSGVLDLYKSTLNGNSFGTPIRMDYPFNSEGDDFAISFLTDDSGYLSSSRMGYDRIYYFEPVKPIIVRDTVKIIETKIEEVTPHEAFSRLKPIYFDFNKSNLRYSTEMNSLLDLVLFMRQFPTVVIGLPSHADCRGNDSYNMKLSKKRGEAVKKYLIETGGIDPGRIQVSEYGASKPVSNCDCSKSTRCNEVQFQANRRVEYELLKY